MTSMLTSSIVRHQGVRDDPARQLVEVNANTGSGLLALT